ncbi:MAG: hypothetical protein U0231_15115 [Nitrospiraceae bacterium]
MAMLVETRNAVISDTPTTTPKKTWCYNQLTAVSIKLQATPDQERDLDLAKENLPDVRQFEQAGGQPPNDQCRRLQPTFPPTAPRLRTTDGRPRPLDRKSEKPERPIPTTKSFDQVGEQPGKAHAAVNWTTSTSLPDGAGHLQHGLRWLLHGSRLITSSTADILTNGHVLFHHHGQRL